MHAIRNRKTYLVAAVVLTGLLLAGCGNDDDADVGSTSGAAPQAADNLAAPDAAAKQEQGTDSPAQAPDLRVEQRSIIYRGSLSVRVKDVNGTAGQATGIATTAGGFVSGDNRNSGSGAGSATLELRIPADKFGAVVDQLAKLGDEDQRQINTEDVTEQVDSGRKLLAQAKSLNDLVMLEREVATRESDLASLQAKKRNLADLTALSTITVTFLDPQADPIAGDDDATGFLGGLAAGWDALLASLKVLLTVLGALLPWLIAIGVPLWAVYWAIRRFRSRPAVPGETALATPGAPQPPAAQD
jgi:outer membrane murein-binding lipoprotein Lpp